jgi:L-lactate dehydrogenase complex protein LldF
MLIGLRQLQHEHRPDAARSKSSEIRHTLSWERLAYGAWKAVLRRPWLYRVALSAARWLTWPLAKDGWLRRLPGPGAGWTQARDFPAPARQSFRDLWKTL